MLASTFNSTLIHNTKMKIKTFGAVLLAIGLACSSGQSAVITWTSANITGDANVLTTSSQALSFGGSDTTVNGVAFTAVNASGTVGSGVGALTIPVASFRAFTYGSGSAPFSLLSVGYGQILESGMDNATSSNIDLTINGLTSGQDYKVLFWLNDSRQYNRSMTFTAGNSSTIWSCPSATAGGLGQFVTGVFTADASTQVIGTQSAEANWQLNAYQIAAVPEPSAYAMLLVGSGLIFVLRRRTHRA